jgi:hypothetical protein
MGNDRHLQDPTWVGRAQVGLDRAVRGAGERLHVTGNEVRQVAYLAASRAGRERDWT